MQKWLLNGDRTLKCEEDLTKSSNGVTLKIRKALLSLSDLDLFRGKFDTDYPIVPTHMATAYVSEDYPELGLKQGEKVLINPYIDTNSLDKKVYGINVDGFMKEFVTVDGASVVQIPESVDEDEALFADYIGLVLSAFSCFHYEKGDYVAIIGDGIISLIASQLAIYYQLIPIFISSDNTLIKKATECGVYYTINYATDDPRAKVLEMTGGRMAERTILEAREGAIAQYLFGLAAENGEAVIISQHDNQVNLTTDIFPIVKKNLSVYGVSDSEEEWASAIYILAQNVLNLDGYVDKEVPAKDAEQLFEELDRNPQAYLAPVVLL